jgi:UDP:flavonoid glycosyltransferase YjiC (YdhE family)
MELGHLLLDEVISNPTYRDNARKLQKAIAEANGLSVAADLVEESLGGLRKLLRNWISSL